TVRVRSSSAESDESKHVWAAVDNRSPCSLEQWPAGPHDNGCRQNQLQEGQPLHHAEDQHWNAEGACDPESPRHVVQFGVLFILESYRLRLQRHAALRACSRTDLTYLWMHRAGIDDGRIGFWRHHFRRCFSEKLFGVGAESLEAAGIAEIVRLAFVVVLAGSSLRHNFHVTDRI